MIAYNLKHMKKIIIKMIFVQCSMPCKELAFSDVKRKVVKTHRHVYDYSANNVRVFFHNSVPICCV